MTIEFREVTGVPGPDYLRVAVAARDGRALGVLTWNVWSDEIEVIRVDDDHQGHGIARLLLEWTENYVGHPLRATGDFTPEGLAFWKAIGRKPGRTRRVPEGEDLGARLLAYLDEVEYRRDRSSIYDDTRWMAEAAGRQENLAVEHGFELDGGF